MDVFDKQVNEQYFNNFWSELIDQLEDTYTGLQLSGY